MIYILPRAKLTPTTTPSERGAGEGRAGDVKINTEPRVRWQEEAFCRRLKKKKKRKRKLDATSLSKPESGQTGDSAGKRHFFSLESLWKRLTHKKLSEEENETCSQLISQPSSNFT